MSSKKQRILDKAHEVFPGKASHVRKLGGVDELLVSEPRDPKESLTSSVSRQRYLIVSSSNDFNFVKIEK